MNAVVLKLMREARERKGLTQKEVGEKLGLKDGAISKWEKGKSEPSIDAFVQYCKICGADYVEILTQAYGDPTTAETITCTHDEAEMLYRFRKLNSIVQRVVRNTIDNEFEREQTSFGEESPDVISRG